MNSLENFAPSFMDPQLFMISSVIIVVSFIFLVIYKLFGKKNLRGDTILFLGLTNSGKTVMFTQLRDGTVKQTHTSMRENDDTFPLHPSFAKEGGSTKPVHVVDFPDDLILMKLSEGHERLRPHLKDFLPITRCIVFVVDSVELQSQIRPLAEFVFDLLTNKTINKQRIPILFACNKQDLLTANKKETIQKAIEKELDKLRQTRRTVPDQDAAVEEVTLGTEGEPFSMDQVSDYIHVDFAECSAKEGNLADIVNFIQNTPK